MSGSNGKGYYGPHEHFGSERDRASADTNGSAPDFGLPTFADMSSQQRSASMDNIARQVEGLTRQVNALTARHADTGPCDRCKSPHAMRILQTYVGPDGKEVSIPAVVEPRLCLSCLSRCQSERAMESELRLDAIERAVATERASSFWQRLRRLVNGR